MAIDLGSNISQSDKNKLNDKKNPSSVDAGDFDDIFGGSDSDGFDSLDSFFDDADSAFGDSGKSSGGSSFDSFGSNGFGSNGFGSNNALSNSAFGQQNQMNPFGNGFMGQSTMQQQPQKPDMMDKAIEYSSDSMVSIGKVIIELFKSIKTRTADELGYLSRNLIITGVVGTGACLVISALSGLVHFDILTLNGITKDLLLGMAFTGGFGMCSLGATAYFIASADKVSTPNLDEIPDVASFISDDATDDYENNLDDVLDDLFSDEDDSETFEFESSNINTGSSDRDSFDDLDFTDVPTVKPIDYDEAIENLNTNTLSNRKNLVDTFMNFLPLNTPDFISRKEITSGSDDFATIETMCMKALANILKVDIVEVESSLSEAYETYFSYELKVNRVKGLNMNKMAEFESELEIYFRPNASDTSVNASVKIEGDYYKIVITKGVTAIVTLGDALKNNDVYKFFIDEKNKLPIIAGIGELGDVITADAKKIDTMMIAGKPRSGKSWYVLGILLPMMLFNSPEDVQFIIIDPKESNLFKTMGLMPHVAGVHNDSNVLNVLADIIDNEAPRRKKLLNANHCDDIWALRNKGIKLPILYVIIDEYITVKSNLETKGLDKELDSKLQVLISQLPSQGIRLIFVPHRATGVVNKTNRTMLQFTASVRGDNDDVTDTLGIKSWKHNLINPGDIALKFSDMPEGRYVRGVALSTSDEENDKLIENTAKAFYKLGVDMPDMSSMSVAVNRNERKIQERLYGSSGSKRIKYGAEAFGFDSADSILSERDI